MGLDISAFITSEPLRTAVDFDVVTATEIHNWRKHPNLHGWMENLYLEKGGSKEFNCAFVSLAGEDLDRLEADIRANRLPDTTDFFFGESDGSELKDDLAFIAKAREAISNGLSVFCSSRWW